MEESSNKVSSQDGARKVSYLQMFKYTTMSERAILLFASLMSLGQGATMPVFALVYGMVASDFTPTSTPESIKSAGTTTALYMLYIGIATFFLSFIGTFLWSWVGARLNIRLKKLYFNSLTGQELGWFDVKGPERLTITYLEDMTKMRDAVGHKNHQLIFSVATCLLGFLVGYIQGWWYSVIVTLTFPLITFGMVIFVIVNQKEAKLSKDAYERSGAFSEQCLSSIKTVKSLCGEDHEEKAYSDALDEATGVSIKYGIYSAFSYGAFMLCLTASYGLNYWLGSVLVDREVTNTNMGRSYNLQDVVTIFFAIVNGGTSMGHISPCLKALAVGKEAASAIYEIIERPSKILLNDPAGHKPESIEGEIEFVDVKFSYPSRKDTPVLNGVNLKIPKGKKVALVGETGCGKSTTIQLLERYYDPLAGEVRIDGKDIRSYNLTALRKFIGYVGQEPVLFAMSIRENLMLAKPDATQEEITNALSQANAWEFISKLEAGLDTYVGSGGSQLSGGQKQRICIARSILQNPKILLLDEATSALDRKNEKEIQETLDKLSAQRTTVTIAHRLSTVMNADIIYAFEKGRAVEFGTHEELLKRGGVYAKLVQIQMHGHEGPTAVPETTEMEAAIPEENDSPVVIKTPAVEIKPIDQPEEEPLAPTLQKGISSQRLKEELAARKAREQMLELEKKEVAKSRLKDYLKGEYFYLIGGCVCALFSGCVMPLFALFIADMLTVLSKYEVLRVGLGPKYGYTFDDVRSESGTIALGFIYIAIGAFVVNGAQLSFFNTLGARITKKLRTDVFRHFITRDMAFFDKKENSPGELSSVLAKDCLVVNSVVSTAYGAILVGIGSFACGLIIAFTASWKISLVTIGFAPLIFISGIVRARGRGTSKNQGGATKRDDTQEFRTFQETCTNMRTVFALNALPEITKNFGTYVDTENHVTNAHMAAHAGLEGFAQFILFLLYAVTFLCGAKWTADDGLTFNNLFRSFMAITLASFGASMGQQFVSDLGEAEDAARRIFEYMDIQNKIINPTNGLKTPIVGHIEFKDVKFTYPERNLSCFESLSFEIQPKQKVAFAGPSGTGKSTIFGLLYRFYDPEQGQILIDGVDIRKYDIPHLRKSLGMVGQEPVLFNETIGNNIKYNRYETTQEEIMQASIVSSAIKFIQKDEQEHNEKGATVNQDEDGQGFDRKVGMRGNKLSGGQKQRVAIARTVVRKPTIYMFDEATSALDTESEKIVQAAINEISKENTSLSIAHRISTIRACDVIFVIEKGRVVEQGTYDELLAQKGVFYEINKHK